MKTGKTLVELAQEIQRRAESKKDLVVDTRNLRMTDKLTLDIGGTLETGVNNIAHEQIGTVTEIPRRYYDKMREQAPALLAANVNAWFDREPAERMVRTLDGNARAFLSNKYRPLENEDLAAAVLPALGNLQLDIMSCEITDRRLYIKAVDKKVNRELAKTGNALGDGQHKIVRVAAPAITISNSEVGMGALSIMVGVYDQFCSNLATFGERSMRKFHTGARHELLSDEMFAMLSDDTRRKTDAALWAQVGEIVRNAFDPRAFNALVDKIEGTQIDRITGDPVKVIDLSARKLGLMDSEKPSILRHLIEGGELSRFGLYNAVTRAAQDVESYDRATELERIGAQVIELAPSEWRQMDKLAA